MIKILFAGSYHYGLSQIRLISEEAQKLAEDFTVKIYQFIHHDAVHGVIGLAGILISVCGIACEASILKASDPESRCIRFHKALLLFKLPEHAVVHAAEFIVGAEYLFKIAEAERLKAFR